MSLQFSATTVRGSRRGRGLGTPTINLNLPDIPHDIRHGIYVCRCRLDDSPLWLDAAMHLGPRPVFKDATSCEVHLLDRVIEETPQRVEVRILAFLRDVRDFPSPEDLQKQIEEDLRRARVILKSQK